VAFLYPFYFFPPSTPDLHDIALAKCNRFEAAHAADSAVPPSSALYHGPRPFNGTDGSLETARLLGHVQRRDWLSCGPRVVVSFS